MKAIFIGILLSTIAFDDSAQSGSLALSQSNQKEEYLMFVVQTLYNSTVGGSTISIYYPDQTQPTIIKPIKGEDFRITVLRSLNDVGKQGWSVVNSHHREFQVSGNSGTSSEETVYLFKKVLNQ